MRRLVILTTGFEGQGCDLLEDRISVGRTADNTLQIRDDSISSHHCELVVSPDAVWVKDLHSTNGTFVDGQALETGPLLPGQVLRLGNVALRLEANAPGPKARLASEWAELMKPLERYRFSPVWRGRAATVVSGLWAGFFTMFINRALPYYPHGWRFCSSMSWRPFCRNGPSSPAPTPPKRASWRPFWPIPTGSPTWMACSWSAPPTIPN